MNLWRRFLAGLLCILLLTGQQVASSHSISHWNETEGSQQEQQLPGSHNCELCLAFSQFGATPTCEFSPLLHQDARYPQSLTLRLAAIHSPFTPVFLPRGPPRS